MICNTATDQLYAGAEIMPPSEWAIAESFRLTAKAWVEADAVARQLEEEKTSELEVRKDALISSAPPEDKMTDAKAERLVKASGEWRDYIRAMVAAKTEANRMKMKMEYLDKLQWAKTNANANERAEKRLTGLA